LLNITTHSLFQGKFLARQTTNFEEVTSSG